MWVVLFVSGLQVWAGATLLLDAALTAGRVPISASVCCPFSLEASLTKPSSGSAALGDHPESGRVEQLVHTSLVGFLLSQAS